MEFQELEALFSHHKTQLADAEKHTKYFRKPGLSLPIVCPRERLQLLSPFGDTSLAGYF